MRIKRKTKRFFVRALLAIPGGALLVFLYLLFRPPSSAAPSLITVEATQARIDRGKYLFTALAACDRCHSEGHSSRGKGMVMPLHDLPGRIVASNITPDAETGIGTWTDGEKIRAIREGVSRDGRPLFPLMPYQAYASISDEDVQSMVAYMNSLPAVRNPLPRT